MLLPVSQFEQQSSIMIIKDVSQPAPEFLPDRCDQIGLAVLWHIEAFHDKSSS